jgi:pimeloyl-ACP methyl ester carboxylesterase
LARKEQFHGGRSSARSIPPALRAMRFLFATLGRVFPGLMSHWAYALWFRTRRFPESAAGKCMVRNARNEEVIVDGVPLVVHIWGEGPTVLFLHGWSGRGSQVAAFVEPLLAAGYRVVAADAPGHGESPGDKTNILEVAAAVQVFGEIFGPVHAAITHSFGGMVLAYAMNHGLSVGRVVMISAPAHVGYLIAGFAQTLAIPASVIAAMQKRINKRFAGEIWERLSTVYSVKELAAPALIIHDEYDNSVGWEQGKIIADAWPGAQFMKTSGLGHGRILRDKKVVDATVEFIKG